MPINLQTTQDRYQKPTRSLGSPALAYSLPVDELRERRARGLQKKIDALSIVIANLVVAVERVERDNADLSASLTRSRWRVVKGRGD